MERLLEGLDSAFEASLHSRFAGGIEASVAEENASGDPQMLRAARGDGGACLRLLLHAGQGAAGAAPGRAALRGLPIGVIRLSAAPHPHIEEVSVLAEIFEERDPNESADATLLNDGIGMRLMSDNTLLAVRSRQAGAACNDQDLQRQRAWRPQGRRHISSGMLGNAGRSRRASTPPSLPLPVAADLLARIGAAIAALDRDFSLVEVLVDPGP